MPFVVKLPSAPDGTVRGRPPATSGLNDTVPLTGWPLYITLPTISVLGPASLLHPIRSNDAANAAREKRARNRTSVFEECMVLVGSRCWVVPRDVRLARPRESLRQKISGRLRATGASRTSRKTIRLSKLLPVIAEILAVIRNHRVGPGLLRNG